MRKIIVTGSLAYDYIMDYPQTFEENILPEKLHTLSVSFLVHNFSKNFGGVAGNIAYNLGLLGTSASVLASAGRKDFEPYLSHLEEHGVETKYIHEVKNEFSANMFLMTDKNNCQIAGFYPGAMQQDEKLSLLKLDEPLEFVIIAPTVPTAMERFVKQTQVLRVPYLYDPAQQIPRLSKEQLTLGINKATIIIGNDYELAMMSKKTAVKKRDFLTDGKIVITTLGANGSVIEQNKEVITIGVAKPKNIVDPTGAGDAYIAGFLTGYAKNYDLKTCGQMGATAASFAIEKYGTQRHQFNSSQFKQRYRQTFKEVLK